MATYSTRKLLRLVTFLGSSNIRGGGTYAAVTVNFVPRFTVKRKSIDFSCHF